MSEIIVVFTAKSIEEIVHYSGTSAWTVNPQRATKAKYAVVTRNLHNPIDWNPEFGRGKEPHGSAFLVGKLKGAVEDTGLTDSRGRPRYHLPFSEYAVLEPPILDVWNGQRMPFHYASEKDIPLDFESLNWVSLGAKDGQPLPQEKAEYSSIELIEMLAKSLNKSTDDILKKLMSA